MSFPGAPVLLTIYYLVLAVLAFYGAHRLVLVAVYLRTRRRLPPRPADPREWPVVTVQLPLYNEMYVARRLVEAVCRLDYPRGRLEVQVLDDSTDETAEIVARAVAEQRALGVDIHHLRRPGRRGFKAGALEEGLQRARGKLVAVFDADFVPGPDFLRRAVPWFADPGVGLVQGSWAHLNREYSLLTRAQAILLDGHFQIEHTARHRGGCFFNFNGTAGIWRRQAIEESGGWQHDTLTEDLDLSYRAQLAGWRFVYLPELAVPAELPVDVEAFKGQQHRWTQGSIQTGRKLLGRILAAPLPWRVKLEAVVHLTNNASYLLMVVMALLVFPAILIRRGAPPAALLLVDLPLFLAATVSVIVYYLASQSAGGQGWRGQVRYLPAVLGLGIGLSVNNARAVLAGLFQKGGTFHRTPKYRIEARGDGWLGKRYRPGRSLSSLVELGLAAYFLACVAYAVANRLWISLPFLYLFVQGYTYMAVLSLGPWVRERFGRGRAMGGAT